MLVESSAKFAPGSLVELRLCGPDDERVMPARWVRSDVADVDGFGVRYHAAAVFERTFDLGAVSVCEEPIPSPLAGLAEWLRQISTALEQGKDPRALQRVIELGLLRTVSARKVQIRETAIASEDGCESILFPVSARDRSRAVLQATFAPASEPSELDFKLLQAGACLAAVVLQAGGCAAAAREAGGR